MVSNFFRYMAVEKIVEKGEMARRLLGMIRLRPARLSPFSTFNFF